MAFRTQIKTGALLILWMSLPGVMRAQPGTYEVRHRHLRNGGPGVLHIDDQSISFEERGKPKHAVSWKLGDIQQLVLGTETLRIVSYDDNHWQFGRDRVYVFDRLPANVATDWYPVFRAKLDQRFVAALADDQLKPDWQIPAKLIEGRSGSQGVVLVGTEEVVYQCSKPGESRSWRISDLVNVSSSDAFDLTIATHERDFRFQLKQVLPEARYNELWRRVNLTNGLQILGFTTDTGVEVHQGDK
jgi:hypothetical protein